MFGDRISWDEYFMSIADLVSRRSTCRRQVGAILVIDDRVISAGYNGAPKGLKHCSEMGGCIRINNNIKSGTCQEMCRAIHAEQNAIIQAAVRGCSIKDSILYTNTYPCSICARMIINAEIKKIIYKGDYEDQLSKELLEEAGIKMIKYNPKQ